MMTFGSMGNLPDDLFSCSPPKLTDTVDLNAFDIDISGLSQVWADQKDKNISLVGNIGALADLPAMKKNMEGIDRAKIIKGARKLLIEGGSRQQLDQYLALNGQDASIDPEIKGLYDEIGLIGNVYVIKEAFERCDDLKVFWRKHKNSYAEYLVGNDECKHCNLNIDRCPQSGLKVVYSMDYTPEILAKYRQKLVLYGKCKPNIEIENKEQLRTAFLVDPEPQVRYSSTQKTTKPVLCHDELIERLAAEEKQKDDARQQESLVFAQETELQPILRHLQELMLSGSDLNTIRESFERKGFPSELISKYASKIKELLGDDLIRVGIKIVPEFYPNCESARRFLSIHNNIRPKFAVMHKNCPTCTHANGLGCRLLSCTLIKSDKIAPIEFRRLAICNLKDKSLLSSSEAGQCDLIEHFQPCQGLKMAYQCIDGRRSRTPVKVSDAAGQLPRSQESRLDGNKSVISSCIKAMHLGVKISDIEKKLQEKGASETAKGVIESALCMLKTVNAGQLDHCMIHRYPLNTDCQIISAEKCSSCPQNSEKILCKSQGLIFQIDPILQLENNLEDVSSEAREIQGYFKDSKMNVEINADPNKKPLDIELDNPGNDLVVESGDKSNSIEMPLSSFQASELNVEIDSPRADENPLYVKDLGTSSFNLNI